MPVLSSAKDLDHVSTTVDICKLLLFGYSTTLSFFFLQGFHSSLQAIYLFGFGVPLFIDNNEHIQKFKWGLWVIHKLLLAGIYGMIFFMYNSKWRERLPGKYIYHSHPPYGCISQ